MSESSILSMTELCGVDCYSGETEFTAPVRMRTPQGEYFGNSL